MSDALISPSVAAGAGVVAVGLIAVAIQNCTAKASTLNPTRREYLFPLMGVLGAFVFAAQMINFTIPGTGSSGHIVGGILLAAILGPWPAFLTLSSVLIIQALIFADGGILALGCNIVNMAAMSCLVAYPIFFRTLVCPNASAARITTASIIASVIALVLGAAALTAETALSGVAAMPMRQFLLYMVVIHLVIGFGEGIATAAVLAIVRHYRPDILFENNLSATKPTVARRAARVISLFAIAALIIGASFSWVASSKPDGLEWSIEKVADNPTLANPDTHYHRIAAQMQEQTALMPDYDTSLAGILGSGAIILGVFVIAYIFRYQPRR